MAAASTLLTCLTIATTATSAASQDMGTLLAASMRICLDERIVFAEKIDAMRDLGWVDLVEANEFSAAKRAFADGLVAVEFGGNAGYVKEAWHRSLRYDTSQAEAEDHRNGVDGSFSYGAEPLAYLRIARESRFVAGKMAVFDGPSFCSFAFRDSIDPTPALTNADAWQQDTPSKMGHYFLSRDVPNSNISLLMAANIQPASFLARVGETPTVLTFVTLYPKTQTAGGVDEN